MLGHPTAEPSTALLIHPDIAPARLPYAHDAILTRPARRPVPGMAATSSCHTEETKKARPIGRAFPRVVRTAMVSRRADRWPRNRTTRAPGRGTGTAAWPASAAP